METLLDNRLDPSEFSQKELEELERANEFVRSAPKNQRAVLHLGVNKVNISIPAPVYVQFVKVLRALSEGQALVILPENGSLTTQQAAAFLGTSRVYLVSLLDSNQIKHHMVGTHRRVYIRDLLEYREKRDKNRRHVLDQLTRDIEKAGLYESSDSAHER